MNKTTEKIIVAVAALLLIWLVISFIDINLHNLGNEHYMKWNLFSLLFNKKIS